MNIHIENLKKKKKKVSVRKSKGKRCIICSFQGFRINYSTETATLHLIEQIQKLTKND